MSILQVLGFIFQNVCFAFLRHFWWLLFKTENQSLHLIGSYETFCEVSKGFSIALDFIFACKTLTISTHSFHCMVETLLLLNGNYCSIKSFFIYSRVGAPVAITHKLVILNIIICNWSFVYIENSLCLNFLKHQNTIKLKNV